MDDVHKNEQLSCNLEMMSFYWFK